MEHIAAIQIRSSSSIELALSKVERDNISNELENDLKICWLAPAVREDKKINHSSLDAMVIIFLVGVGLSGLLKPFMDGFLGEAGKDLWLVVKKLIKSILRKQVDKAYRLDGEVLILMEHNEEHIGISIKFNNLTNTDSNRYTIIDKLVDDNVSSLEYYLPNIINDVNEWEVGAKLGGKVHLIEYRNDKWRIYPYNSLNVLTRDRIEYGNLK